MFNLRYILSLVTATLMLSACGGSFTLLGAGDGGGNAEGYPGDFDPTILAGRYLLDGDKTTCLQNGQAVPAFKYQIEITPFAEAWISSAECQTNATPVRTNFNDIWFALYNRDFFAKLGAAYARAEKKFIDGERARVEALCRRTDTAGTGLDIVWLRLETSGRNLAYIYWRSTGGAAGTAGPIDAESAQTANTKIMTGTGVTLTIDTTTLYTRRYAADALRGQFHLAGASISLSELSSVETALLCTSR
ncbi:MAG TPA: hypothetical protein VFV50_03615 [Bdellovibrionales bacterium]|nr:hypothetical protein [Bdellovibrionales bacterium]